MRGTGKDTVGKMQDKEERVKENVENSILASDTEEVKQQEDNEKFNEETKEQQIARLTEENCYLEIDILELKQELAECRKKIDILDTIRKEIAECMELIELLSSQHVSTFDESDRDRIAEIEQQLSTFASDFEEERSYREKIQENYTNLLVEVKEKDHIINKLKEELRESRYNRNTKDVSFGWEQQQKYNHNWKTNPVSIGWEWQQKYGHLMGTKTIRVE